MGKYTKIKADGGPLKGKKKPAIKVSDPTNLNLHAYLDSSNLHNAYLEQLKYNPPQDVNKSYAAGLSIAKDYINSDKDFKSKSKAGRTQYFKPSSTQDKWTSEAAFKRDVPEDAPLIDKYKNLTFSTPTETGLWTTPDLYNQNIAPIGIYYGGKNADDGAWNPIWAAPTQPYEYTGDINDVLQYRSNPTIHGAGVKFSPKTVLNAAPVKQKGLNIPSIQYNPKDTNPYNKYVVNRYLPTPESPVNPKPYNAINLYTAHQNLANQGMPVGQINEDGKWRDIMADEYNAIMNSSVQGGAKLENTNYAMGGMIKRKDGSYSKRGLWDNIRANKGSGKEPTKEMLEQEAKIKAEYMYGGEMPDMYGKGGYIVTRSSDRKGKTHKVTGPDGSVKYFGDSKLGQHPNDPARKKAFYARHEKNLKGNPHFRAFARKTWAEGGYMDEEIMAMGGRMNQAQQLNAGKMRIGSDAPDGEVWKGIGAGAYGVLEGTLDTVSMGMTDKLTDAGYKRLQKLGGSGNTRQQDMIRGFGNIGGAVVGAVVNPASTMTAVNQGIKGLGQGVGNINENTQGIGNAISGLSGLTGLIPSGGGMEKLSAMGAQMSFKQGGLMHINEGGTHEQNALGGVPIGPNALVEQGETINNNFVFSDRLKPKGSKKTYAQLSKSVDTKYRLRPDDKLSKEAKQMDLDRLAMQQETQKDEMSTKYMQKAMACGGKIMSNGGSFMGPISQSMNVTNGQNTLLANGGLMSNFMEKPTVYQNPANLSNQYKYGGNMYDAGGPLEDFTYDNPQTAAYPNYMFNPNTDISPQEDFIEFPLEPTPAMAELPQGFSNTPVLDMSQYVPNNSTPPAQNPYPEVGNTGYLTNLAGNLVKAGMVATSKPPIYNPSVKLNRMNANPAERLAMQEGRREIQGTKDIIRNNATSSGQYLTNASLMGSSAANKLAGTIGGIRQGYDTQNVGIGNQEAQLNQQITSGNNLAKEQFRDNRLNQYNKILDSVIGANQQRFATDVHANNFQNQVISLLKTGVYHYGKSDEKGMYEILGPNNEVITKMPKV